VVVTHPDDPNQQFFGVTGDDGSLHVSYRTKDGIPPGTYEIRIRSITQRDGQPLPPGEEGAVLRQAGATVSREFVFNAELKSGPNELDLKLENGRLKPPAGPSPNG
jgi:hypothetical protein